MRKQKADKGGHRHKLCRKAGKTINPQSRRASQSCQPFNQANLSIVLCANARTLIAECTRSPERDSMQAHGYFVLKGASLKQAQDRFNKADMK